MGAHHDGRVDRQHMGTPRHPQHVQERFRARGKCHGVRIDEYECFFEMVPLVEFLNHGFDEADFLGEFRNGAQECTLDEKPGSSNPNLGEDCQVLEKSCALAFGCFCRAVRKELRRVDAPHERVLAVAWQGSRHSLHVGCEAEGIDLVNKLNHSGAGIGRLLYSDLAL